MKKITCTQAEEMFSLMLDGAMDPEEERVLQAHFKLCSRCKQEYELTAQITAAMRKMPRVECPDPNFSHHIINILQENQPEKKLAGGGWAGRFTGWKKGLVAAAAAVFIMASSLSLSGGWTGIQLVWQGPDDNPNNKGDIAIIAKGGDLGSDQIDQIEPAGDDPDTKTPGTDTDPNLNPQDPEPEKQPRDKEPGQEPATNTNKNQPAVETGDSADSAGSGQNTPASLPLETAPMVLLSNENELVAKSTTLKLMVENAATASAKAEAMAAAAGGSAQLLANQNTDQGHVQIIRIAVTESQAGALIGSLTGLGSELDRQQESRNMTSQYNKLATRHNELAATGDDPGTQAERVSLKQQMNILNRDAQSHTVILWIQER